MMGRIRDDGKDLQFVTTKDLLEHYAAVRNRLNGRQKVVEALKAEIPPNAVVAKFIEPWRFSLTHQILLDPDLKLPITIFSIIRAACFHFGIQHNEITSIRRNKDLCTARHVAMYLCHELTSNSYPQIGSKFGGRDHTTILHAVQKVKHQLSTGSSIVKRDVDSIKAML
jgi:hypothetical protein